MDSHSKIFFLPRALVLSLLAVAGIPQSALASPAQPERRARQQPTVPEGYRELPFVETAPEPVPTGEEKKRGYLLFTRPITEPVQANTRPLESERLVGGLSAFATPGEWEPLTLGVYPLRNLENFRLRVSDLRSPDGNVIESSQLTPRLQTYWNIGYPRYASRETYRRVPELLERVDTHSSPAHEAQRWWIQVHVPTDAPAGLYQGTVTVQDDGFDQPVVVPLSLRVLGFPLQQDPAKHYSAYYQTRDRVSYQDKDEAFYQQASANEFRAMRDYGIDQFPTLYLITDKDATKILIRNEEEIERLVAAGMKGRIPILGGNAISRIYQATTPGGIRESHWKINKMPPPEFYQRLTKLFSDFEQDRVARGWPPMICCPLDEVAASHKDFGVKVFKAVHAAGIPTYITKFPTAADAPDYAPYVDVWCSQPYAIPYEEIVAQQRHEYWSYPNHNAGERKNRRIMCKGGRMTYGFGLWRSGYTTLIPWHWSWTMTPDPFDYLRSKQSGSGMRIDDNGEIIPALYWECFREGRDDARYLYTLQQAVFERETSTDPKCKQQIKAAKTMLQENWDAIEVQQRYLSERMWPSPEFNARRWRLANMIETLLAFPAQRKGTAPSVLVASTGPRGNAKHA
ncbi:MAG: glycoside hydrolase domain-containing protein, partial [Verrucomicrobiales bacterium]